MRNIWTKEELNFIKENYLNLSDKEISDKLGSHTESSVTTKRKRMGLIKNNRKYSFKDVLEEFKKTEYQLISTEEDYIDSATNSLKYICTKHLDKGIQMISLGHLQSGRGCYYCGRNTTEQAHRIDLTNDEESRLICESKGFEYIDSLREDGLIYIQYICKKHPEAGIQKMRKGNMKRDNIQGCPYCFDTKKFKFSKGEKRIEEVLNDLSILYLPQYTFNDCKDVNVLPFDFYLLDLNVCIEYDGQHHYYPVTFNGISQEQAKINHLNTIHHDKIKNEYCDSNGIKLLRIPYYEFKNIKDIIVNFINDNCKTNYKYNQ
jgi:very-short-patch-repair endonuclease